MQVSTNLGKKRKLENQLIKIKLYRQIDDKSQFLCLQPGYVMTPSPAQIFEKKFLIKDLIIRYKNTQIFWKGVVDLRSLKAPLYTLIDLGPTYVEVYPDDYDKPMAGKELNRTCFVTFRNLINFSKTKLKKVCQSNGCQILATNSQMKQFTVQIPHFSKFQFGKAFEDEDSNGDEIQEESKQLNLQNSSMGFVQSLKESHAKNLLKENQIKRNAVVIALPNKNIKNSLPSLELQGQVKHHNQSHGHHMTKQKIKGSAITIGANGIVNSYSSACNINFMFFTLQSEKNRDILNIALKLLHKQELINQIILSSEASFKIKRILSLYAICFKFQSCLFSFQREQNNLKIVKSHSPPLEHYKPQYLKNWFQWVINEDKTFNIPQSQILKGLCTRKTAQLAKKSQKFKLKDDAEFLSKIEDVKYRSSQPSRFLSIEFRAISLGDMGYFNKLHWIVKLGVFLWYYSFKQSNDDLIKEIIQQNMQATNNYNLQRHILITFFEIPYSTRILSPTSDEDLPLWWLLCNKNNEREEKNNDNNKIYHGFRYNLLNQLVNIFADGYVTFDLISHDLNVTKEEKLKILKEFVKKYPMEAEKIPISDWVEYSDLINENKALESYANHQYFKTLYHLGKCEKISQPLLQIIKQITRKQQLIFGVNKKTIQKTRQLLQKLKTNIVNDQIVYLNILLGKQQLTKQKIKSMFDLCSNITKQNLKQRMIDVIFESLIKSPHCLALLKEDNDFSRQVNLIFKKPAHQLKLKIAKLQI